MRLNEIQQANALAEAKQAKEKRCVMRSSKPTKLSAREAQNHWFSTETESITKESEKLREGVREGERETPPPRRDWPKLEAALVQKNGKDSDMFCRRSHVTESEGCGGGGFLLRYSGKCNYGWTGAWRSRCGCLKVCKGRLGHTWKPAADFCLKFQSASGIQLARAWRVFFFYLRRNDMNKKGFYKNFFVHICYCLPDFCVQRAWTNPDDPGQTVGLFSLLVLKKKKKKKSPPPLFSHFCQSCNNFMQ